MLKRWLTIISSLKRQRFEKEAVANAVWVFFFSVKRHIRERKAKLLCFYLFTEVKPFLKENVSKIQVYNISPSSQSAKTCSLG